MIDFGSVRLVMDVFKSIIYGLPDDLFSLLQISFWLFCTLSVIRVVGFKENG